MPQGENSVNGTAAEFDRECDRPETRYETCLFCHEEKDIDEMKAVLKNEFYQGMVWMEHESEYLTLIAQENGEQTTRNQANPVVR